MLFSLSPRLNYGRHAGVMIKAGLMAFQTLIKTMSVYSYIHNHELSVLCMQS